MYKVLLLFAAAIAATHCNPRTSRMDFFPSIMTLFTNTSPNTGVRIQMTTAAIRALDMTATTNCAIVTHGRYSTRTDEVSPVLRDALLTSGTVNVIVVDWSQEANGQYAEQAIESIANEVVELIRLLITNSKANQARLHLIGFDLGAHLVGRVARTSTYTIPRITGLNPPNSADALRRLDASYVEVIHTEVNRTGTETPMGHAEFYPNGGKNQTGCADDTACSHNRAWELFAASLTHGRIIGNRCSNLTQAVQEDAVCTGFTMALGTNDLVKYGNGIFRLETSGVYPYRCLVRCGLVDKIIKIIDNAADDPSTTPPGPGTV